MFYKSHYKEIDHITKLFDKSTSNEYFYTLISLFEILKEL